MKIQIELDECNALSVRLYGVLDKTLQALEETGSKVLIQETNSEIIKMKTKVGVKTTAKALSTLAEGEAIRIKHEDLKTITNRKCSDAWLSKLDTCLKESYGLTSNVADYAQEKYLCVQPSGLGASDTDSTFPVKDSDGSGVSLSVKPIGFTGALAEVTIKF